MVALVGQEGLGLLLNRPEGRRLYWPEMGKKTFPGRLTATGVLGGVA